MTGEAERAARNQVQANERGFLSVGNTRRLSLESFWRVLSISAGGRLSHDPLKGAAAAAAAASGSPSVQLHCALDGR